MTVDVTVSADLAAEATTEWAGEFVTRPISVSDARSSTHRCLARLGWTGDRDDAVLVVSELVTNAVLHSHQAGGSLLLRLAVQTDRTLAIEGTDHDSALPQPGADPSAMTESGRGFFLVHALRGCCLSGRDC
jgi:anti-sigma regulatory factor (Ser/Thr protein kinase)